MKKYAKAWLVTGFVTIWGAGSASAEMTRSGTEEEVRRSSGRDQQPDMQPRCRWQGDYMYCDVLKNCREDETLQMSICDVVTIKIYYP